MYTILIFLLVTSGGLTLAYGIRVILDKRRPKPVFPPPREGHQRRLTFKLQAQFIFSDGSRRDIPVGHHLTEDSAGAWGTNFDGRRFTLTDPTRDLQKMWDEEMVVVDYVPILPVSETPVGVTPEPPTAQTPHTANALLVVHDVTITERDGAAHEIPAGHVLLQPEGGGPWQVMVGDNLITVTESSVLRGISRNWLQRMSPRVLAENQIRPQLERLQSRMNRTMMNLGSSFTEAARAMMQPGVFTETTVTITQPAPRPPEAKPPEPVPTTTPSALDAILADDE